MKIYFIKRSARQPALIYATIPLIQFALTTYTLLCKISFIQLNISRLLQCIIILSDCTYSKQLTDLTMVEQIRLEMGTKHAGGCRYILTSPPKTTLLAIVTDVQLSKELDEIVFNDGGSQASERISVIQSTTKAGNENFMWFTCLIYVFLDGD